MTCTVTCSCDRDGHTRNLICAMFCRAFELLEASAHVHQLAGSLHEEEVARFDLLALALQGKRVGRWIVDACQPHVGDSNVLEGFLRFVSRS